MARLQQQAQGGRRPGPIGYLPPFPASCASQARLAGTAASTASGNPASASASAWQDALVSYSDVSGLHTTAWLPQPPPPSRMTSMVYDSPAPLPYDAPVLPHGRHWQERQAAHVAAVQAALDIARGVAALHEAGVVHGSLRPCTVLCAHTAAPQAAAQRPQAQLLPALTAGQPQTTHPHDHQPPPTGQQQQQQLLWDGTAAARGIGGRVAAATVPGMGATASRRTTEYLEEADTSMPIALLDTGTQYQARVQPRREALYEAAVRCCVNSFGTPPPATPPSPWSPPSTRRCARPPSAGRCRAPARTRSPPCSAKQRRRTQSHRPRP